MELAKGIHRFETGPFNWYVIEESGRITLVDAGFPGHYGVFLDGLKSIGRSKSDVEAIVLTHAHADHTGFAERLRRETNAPVFIHKDDARMATRILQLPWVALLSNAWRPFTAGMLGRAIINGVFTMPSLSKTQAFQDGDILDVPGKPHVLHVPGHTAGESALYLPDRKVLISGDTLVTLDLFGQKPAGPQRPRRQLNAGDKLARRSLDRMRELGAVTMLPGHGKPWAGTMADAIRIARTA